MIFVLTTLFQKADGNIALIGFEASIMNTMSLALNFAPHYQPPSDNKFFGFFIEKNNTFVGMLGDLQVPF